MNKFYLCTVGGAGMAFAIDATIRDIPLFAIVLGGLALVSLIAGWMHFNDDRNLHALVATAERNASDSMAVASVRAAEAGLYLRALLDAREVLHDRGSREAVIEIIDDVLAELQDPAVCIRFCFDWLTDIIHNQNRHWWIDPATGEDLRTARYIVPTKLMLTVSELAEAMEAHRKSLPDDKLPQYPGLTVELVDALFRIFDLAGSQRLTMGQAAADKLAFNASRADHSNAARLSANGKAY